MATNRGKNNGALNFQQMVAAGSEKRQSSKLYRAESTAFVNEQIADLIHKTAEELAAITTTEPVTLTDTDMVKRRTVLYLRSCEESSSFPSLTGLARSMGLSSRAIYDTIERHSPKATAEWLEMFQDACRDILIESSSRNYNNSIVGIFLLKAMFGMREQHELTIKTPTGPLGDEADRAALESRIADIVVDVGESE